MIAAPILKPVILAAKAPAIDEKVRSGVRISNIWTRSSCIKDWQGKTETKEFKKKDI